MYLWREDIYIYIYILYVAFGSFLYLWREYIPKQHLSLLECIAPVGSDILYAICHFWGAFLLMVASSVHIISYSCLGARWLPFSFFPFVLTTDPSLQRGGKCVYFGPIGKDSSDLMGYLTAINPDFALPSERNPADHILDVWLSGFSEALEVASVSFELRNSKREMKTKSLLCI